MIGLDPESVKGVRIAKAIERIAVINWMATEHEEKTLLSHSIGGVEGINYNIIKSVKPLEEAAKSVSCSVPVPSYLEQETIHEMVYVYLSNYGYKRGDPNWVNDWGQIEPSSRNMAGYT